MRPGQLRYAMPGKLRGIHVVDPLAVDMDVEPLWQVRKPFGHDSFAAVALVQERRNDRKPELSRRGLWILQALVHRCQNWNPRRMGLFSGTSPGGCTLTNRSGNRKRMPRRS